MFTPPPCSSGGIMSELPSDLHVSIDQASLPKTAVSFGVLLYGVLSSQATHGDQQILELRMASHELEHRRVCWCWSTHDWEWQGDSTRARLLDTGGCTRAARRGAVRSRAQRRCPVQLGEWCHAGVHRQSSVQAHRLRHSPAATAKPTDRHPDDCCPDLQHPSALIERVHMQHTMARKQR